MINLPEQFVSRMNSILGSDAKAFFAAYENPPVSGLHVNLHKISTSDLVKSADFPLTPLPYTGEGFLYECEKIGNQPLHHAGAVYAQEPSAMMPLSMMEGRSLGDRPMILDVCASPGGKSSQAANLFAGRDGLIVSNEVVQSRCLTLAENIERLGIRNSVVTNLTADQLGSLYRGVFDLTVVDAPCSGEGMFRKNPRAVSEWSEENMNMCADRQWEILSAVAGTVKSGGWLIYSTCTFSTEENEAIVLKFLRTHPDYVLESPPEAVKAVTVGGIAPSDSSPEDGINWSCCRRFYPHLASGEGQFAALLRRVGEDKPRFCYSDALTPPSKADAAVVRAFLKETIGDVGENLTLCARKEGIYAVCPDFPMIPTGLFSPGVRLGSVQKGRLIPHHRFFMAYGQDFVRKLELDRDQAVAYLKGNTVPCTAFTGWGVVTYRGCTLGGIKASDGVAKNHYPKGLRLL
ncbi:MAG: hypothetical protein ACI3XR_05760 [Eubacteriales bacterium]